MGFLVSNTIILLPHVKPGENSDDSRDKVPGDNSNNRAYSYYNHG